MVGAANKQANDFAAAEIARLQNRVEELEELCGLAQTRLPNPFTGSNRGRILVIAKLMAARDLVTRTAIAYAIGGDDFNERSADVYVYFLRKQLRDRGLELKTEWGRGWFLSQSDKAALRSLLEPNKEKIVA